MIFSEYSQVPSLPHMQISAFQINEVVYFKALPIIIILQLLSFQGELENFVQIIVYENNYSIALQLMTKMRCKFSHKIKYWRTFGSLNFKLRLRNHEIDHHSWLARNGILILRSPTGMLVFCYTTIALLFVVRSQNGYLWAGVWHRTSGGFRVRYSQDSAYKKQEGWSY